MSVHGFDADTAGDGIGTVVIIGVKTGEIDTTGFGVVGGIGFDADTAGDGIGTVIMWAKTGEDDTTTGFGVVVGGITGTSTDDDTTTGFGVVGGNTGADDTTGFGVVLGVNTSTCCTDDTSIGFGGFDRFKATGAAMATIIVTTATNPMTILHSLEMLRFTCVQIGRAHV